MTEQEQKAWDCVVDNAAHTVKYNVGDVSIAEMFLAVDAALKLKDATPMPRTVKSHVWDWN